MVISSTVTARSNAREAIQVQLALKRCKFGLAEVGRNYLLDEIFRFVDNKAPSMRLPLYWGLQEDVKGISNESYEHT